MRLISRPAERRILPPLIDDPPWAMISRAALAMTVPPAMRPPAWLTISPPAVRLTTRDAEMVPLLVMVPLTFAITLVPEIIAPFFIDFWSAAAR